MTAPSDRGPGRMFNLQTVVGLLVTVGIIWLGLTRIDLSQTMAAFAAVRVGFVLAGGGLIVAAIAIFAVRWRVLLPSPPDVPVRFFFCYLIIGYMVNAIIPLRLGDLVRAYLLGRRHGIAVLTTLSTVVVERIFDVCCTDCRSGGSGPSASPGSMPTPVVSYGPVECCCGSGAMPARDGR